MEIALQGLKLVIVWNGFKIIGADFSQLTEPIGIWNMAYKDIPRKGGFGVQNYGGRSLV